VPSILVPKYMNFVAVVLTYILTYVAKDVIQYSQSTMSQYEGEYY